MKPGKTLALALAIAVASIAFTASPTFAAGSKDGHAMHGMDSKAAAESKQASQPVPAEIKKIDASTGKVTLKHGPIANLGMSAMTMAFPVKDRASLKNFKEGDSVSVTFDTVDGKATVIDMQRK
ncbi:copper-binding protein [Cupriavidus taiwanensis]|uniref:Signal peptide protein n=1 Tax=Cupriavidus taiwanensis TaxID=164546 RepID=A0A375J9N6_9BURK|nr:copper-binding protein [Cupriavidus taiwanensis]SPS01818.1 Signal peptide protein [Cupriavidus taiwanensis]